MNSLHSASALKEVKKKRTRVIYRWKANLKRYAFRRDLKSERICKLRISAGREFQTLGTEDEKARTSVDLREVVCVTRSLESEEERRARVVS